MKENTRKLNASERKEISSYVKKHDHIGRLKLAEKFNLSDTQARYILSNKEKFSKAKIKRKDDKYISKDMNDEKSHFYHEIHDNIKEIREDGILVNFEILTLLIKSIRESDLENYGKFKITDYFVRKFIETFSYKYSRLHGESLSADLSKINEFRDRFEEVEKRFTKGCIFNLDETAIYIKGLSDHSYIAKDVSNKSVKQQKTRMTLLLGINMEGEKLRPLIVGKSANPRAYRNISLENIGVSYKSNKTGWMTRALFEEYLNELNEQLITQGKKILALVDNFSGHKIENLSNIELMFLPENTTSVLQPLDLGVISSFKRKYKKYLSYYIFESYQSNKTIADDIVKRVNIFIATNWIVKAWANTSKECIVNCWKKSKLKKSETCTEIVLYDQITPASTVKNAIQSVKSTQGESKSVVDMSKNENKSKIYIEKVAEKLYFVEKLVNFTNISNYPNDSYENLKSLENRILNILVKENSKKIKKIMDAFAEVYEEKHEKSPLMKFLIKK